jgi:hypothetical protein
MTDYHVIHLDVPAGEERAETSARIERECDHAAREGWYLSTVIPDVVAGTTRGLWLVFAAGEENMTEGAAVATVNEILSHAGDEPSPA